MKLCDVCSHIIKHPIPTCGGRILLHCAAYLSCGCDIRQPLDATYDRIVERNSPYKMGIISETNLVEEFQILTGCKSDDDNSLCPKRRVYPVRI